MRETASSSFARATSRRSWLAGVVSLAMLAGATGCGSPADAPTREAAAALDRCEVRTARDRFTEAHRADEAHAQAAVGYALTDLAMLAESDEVTALLANFGFTERIDVQNMLFGGTGVLARLSRNESCGAIRAHINLHLNYPPATHRDVNALSLIRAELRGEQLRAGVASVLARLGEHAAALETAAARLERVEAKGSGCGLSQPVTLQRPELYGLAAALEAYRAAGEFLLGYDWDVPVRQVLQNDQAQAEANAAELNAHLFRVRDRERFAASRAALTRALALGMRGLDAARSAEGSVPNALFDWSAFPDERLDDLRRLLVSLQGSLERPTPLADVSPALTVDLGRLFATPPDAANLSGPLWVVRTTESGSYLQLSGERATELTGMATTPALGSTEWQNQAFQWTPSTAWGQFMADPVVAPARRLEGVYRCSNN